MLPSAASAEDVFLLLLIIKNTRKAAVSWLCITRGEPQNWSTASLLKYSFLFNQRALVSVMDVMWHFLISK